MGFTPVPCEPGTAGCCAEVPVVLCDDAGPFLRILAPCADPPTVRDVTLAGEPYAAAGAVVTCASDSGSADKVRVWDGAGAVAQVNDRTDGIRALEVNDDCAHMEAQHLTLVADTDTSVTFAQRVRIVRVLNWSTARRLLVKDDVIVDAADPAATRVGIAPMADVPGSRTFPYGPTTIHLLAAGAAEVTVEGYF